jgi:hypothetical protein
MFAQSGFGLTVDIIARHVYINVKNKPTLKKGGDTDDDFDLHIG